MSNQVQPLIMKHYGISPWEINVITSILDKRFETDDEEIENTYEEKFVSHLEIEFPYSFNEEFFKWFEFREWEKVKHIIKEMKRRRGKGNAITVEILFTGDPNVRFVADLSENHNFNSAIEKIDFVVELLPYHLKDNNMPDNPTEVLYKYDIESGKWMLDSVLANEKRFFFPKKDKM